MAFGIQELERDVQKFRQDIENAKVKYLDEYAEYVNITTDLENIGEKYDFLQEEVEIVAKVLPEERDNTISDPAQNLLISGGVFLGVSGISFMVKKYNAWKLIKIAGKINALQGEMAAIRSAAPKAQRLLGSANQIGRQIDLARASQATRQATKVRAIHIGKFTAGVGGILAIVGIALAISDAVKRKKYLKEQKAELQQHLDDINGYIAEANDDTKTVIDIFSTYFNEFEIDVDGVFNDNRDGFLGESGTQKFEGAVSQLRKALNGAIGQVGELNGGTRLANRRIDRYLSQGYKGKELIEEVVLDTELLEEVIQRLYVFKLRELGSTVQKAIELSQLPEELAKKLYARGYLDDGKTVEETVELSGLTEDRVRRVYASKLLDDRLNTENPDDFLSIKDIAEQVGLSEDIVLEIQLRKIADLPSDSEESELEPELLAR